MEDGTGLRTVYGSFRRAATPPAALSVHKFLVLEVSPEMSVACRSMRARTASEP
jgi:hypothetical protein